MQISPKLEVCGKKEVDIRNQRPRLRRNRLILVEKAGGGGFSLVVPSFLVNLISVVISPIVCWAIDQQIVETKGSIEKRKGEFVQAKRMRKNRQGALMIC